MMGTCGEDNKGIQEGMTKRFLGEVTEKLFVKEDKQSFLLKVGRTVDLRVRKFLTYPHENEPHIPLRCFQEHLLYPKVVS